MATKLADWPSLRRMIKRHWYWTLIVALFITVTQHVVKRESIVKTEKPRHDDGERISVESRQRIREELSHVPSPTIFIAELAAEAGNFDGEFEPREHQELLTIYKRCLEKSGSKLVAKEIIPVLDQIISELQGMNSLDHGRFRSFAKTMDKKIRSLFVEYQVVEGNVELPDSLRNELLKEIQRINLEFLDLVAKLKRIAGDESSIKARLTEDSKLFDSLIAVDQQACVLNRKLTVYLYLAYHAKLHIESEVDVAVLIERQRELAHLARMIADVAPQDSPVFKQLDSYARNDLRRSKVIAALNAHHFSEAEAELVSAIQY